ncbi:MAG: hypothetical protein ACREM2_09360 [Vulcanimicrobiaceae bacterium]
MARTFVRVAVIATLALFAGLGAGFARASVLTLDQVADAGLVPSAAPGLLGPINALGRNGWNCLPEHAARSVSAEAAELPGTDAR